VCGIAGYLHAGPCEPRCERVAGVFLAGLEHRGPDATGRVDLESQHLVHTRLRVVDVSSGADQPMKSADGSSWIVYNGEIYNHASLAADLGIRDLRTHSDTEVLLEGLRKMGPKDLLPRIRGMFSFAYSSQEGRRLTLARDRFGEKPLYLYVAPDLVLFASELGPLASALRALGRPTQVDPQAIAAYLTLGYIPAPLSLLQQVTKLLPGEYVEVVTPGYGAEVFTAKHDMWIAPWSIEPGHMSRPTLTDIGEALKAAVAEQLIADVPVGVFLSGGIDSSLVAWNAVQLGHQDLQTFSIGFESPELDESSYAAAVAGRLGTRHHNRVMTGEDAVEMRSLIDVAFSEPLGDPSVLPTMFVSQLAREHVTAALSGDGGDELFAGYNRYGAFESWASGPRAAALTLLGKIPDVEHLPPRLRNVLPMSRRLSRAQAMGRETHLERYLALVGHKQASAHLRESRMSAVDAHPRIADLWSGDSCGINRLREFDVATYLPGDILAKVDRASMTFSLESRAPFLDSRVAAIASRLPSSTLWIHGQGKAPLRALASRIGAGIESRPKAGFGPPIGTWLKGPLLSWATDLVADDEALRACSLRPGETSAAWYRFLGERDGSDYFWWALLSLLQSVKSLQLAQP
jgi:asparagine synthase (glutamine-hydrolysing)